MAKYSPERNTEWNKQINIEECLNIIIYPRSFLSFLKRDIVSRLLRIMGLASQLGQLLSSDIATSYCCKLCFCTEMPSLIRRLWFAIMTHKSSKKSVAINADECVTDVDKKISLLKKCK